MVQLTSRCFYTPSSCYLVAMRERWERDGREMGERCERMGEIGEMGEKYE
jgi:hypothetical protein